MGSVMSLRCSKRKATSQDVESESGKRRKICSTNDDENCRLISSLPDELSLKHPWSFCANRVVKVAAAVGFFMPFTKFRFPQDIEDSKSSSLSLPSPSTSLFQIWKHHVFPSFHGADVRKTFLSHILESFKRKGIDTFIDNNIERSKSIGPELVQAIKASKIAIILLSRKYASSSWCLDELVEIMNCREVKGKIVMTIFYEVDSTDIKKQTGDFGKAFGRTCKGKTKEHIEKWKKALEDVAKIAGEHSRNWNNEATMIEKIATDVSSILNKSTPSRDFEGLVGMTTHMEEMKGLLRLDLDEVRMIGIWGPPGIGKTTIARFLYNQVSSRFQLRAIMVNIKGCYPKPCLDEYDAQLQLQDQMLSQIINQKDIKISHLGVAQERLKDKKVLLVLDDVDRLGQLHALAKEIQWFGPGSRIIITTEDRRVLKAHRINHIYKVRFPSSDQAFHIFCMHAFGQKHPDDGFFELAWEVTYLVGELPLGLAVLGSALRGISKQEWKRAIPMLKTHLDGKIENIIKFSYNALCDDDKCLFLYIACLFNYQLSRKVEGVLANKLSHVRHRLHVLAERSLIFIEGGEIQMHTLLEQFGKETSRKQFVHHGLTKRQLLVGERDTCELLSDDSTDSNRFIGINFDFSKIEEELNISEKALERMHDFQFVRINNHNFAQPQRLQSVLQGLIYHSQKIRSLDWEHFQNICLPSTFNPEFLVKLNMQGSKLEKLWEGTKPLRILKWMDLSGSSYLKELPDLSTATKLEELILQNCSSLLELPSSIGNAINLHILNLRNCSSLLELPSSVMNITYLEELDLKWCLNLVKLPFSLGNATNLQKLNLSHCTSLVKLPSSIENATNLKKLDLSNCSNLVELPSVGNATNLEELNLDNCSRLVKLPSTINAPNLQILYLNNCSRVVKLPAIENATNLLKFYLQNCSSLQELPLSIGTATNLQKLNISGCSSLVKLPSSIGDLINLEIIDLCDCSSLVELPSSIGNLQRLYKLRMCGCLKLEALPTNINLESLRTVDLTNCSQLKCFPEISTNIEHLKLRGTAIKEVPLSIMSCSRLSDFRISYFESLKEFPHAFDIITELFLINEDIKEVPSWVKGMSRLCILIFYNCNNLVSIPQLSDSLYCLVAENCQSLERLDCSFSNPYIRLEFFNCLKLNQEARDLIMLTSSRRTEVPDCFNHRARSGGSLTIKLNESPLATSLRFKACIILLKDEEESGDDQSPYVYVDIMNKQKDLKVRRRESKHYINRLLTEHIYTFEVEAKEVTSTELVFDFKTYNSKWKIRECGLLMMKT